MLRNLLDRIRDTRSGDTTDPLDRRHEPAANMPADIPAEPEPVDPWLDAITPLVDEDTDPGGADLASVDPLPAGAVRNRQNVYVDGNRCAVCHVPAISEVCVKCKLAGHLPPGMDVYVPPGMDRPLPDPPLRSGDDTRERVRAYLSVRTHPVAPPLHRLDGAGYVLEPLPDVADFEEARGRLRTEVIDRIDAEADVPWIGICDPGPSVAYVNRLCGIDTDGAA